MFKKLFLKAGELKPFKYAPDYGGSFHPRRLQRECRLPKKEAVRQVQLQQGRGRLAVDL